MADAAATWARFCAGPRVFATTAADPAAWRRGRARYFAWVLPVIDEPVLGRWRSLRQALDGYLLQPCARQAHVTVFAAGFPARRPVYNDDIAMATLARQARALARWRPGEIGLYAGAANSFLSAAFVEIGDPSARLAALRRLLGREAAEIRPAPYLPHLTAGVYPGPFATRTLVPLLSPMRGCARAGFRAAQVALVSYDAREPAGSLRVETCIELAADRPRSAAAGQGGERLGTP